MKSILVVDDDEVTRTLLHEVFTREGYRVTLASSGEAACTLLKTQKFPVVLSDIRMIDLDGFGLLEFIQAQTLPSVIVLMTGFGSMEGALQAIKRGAFDYLSKPFRIEDLKAVIDRAYRHSELIASEGAHSMPLRQTEKSFVGASPAIVEVYRMIARAALVDSTVLIMGETGTGKELAARAIHNNGPRAGKRMVSVNCGALAESLLEAELFGYVKGAFTGANQDHRGLLEEADGGTLFLDEIGDVSLGLQVKLLRFLQEREFKPVGSSDARSVDVRVIAATHRDLEAMVKRGEFREDLYYRLRVILLTLPPLRLRIEDLPALVEHFVARFSERAKRAVSHVSEEAMTLLKKYRWPGNIRELEHAIERAVAMGRTRILFPEDFAEELRVVGLPSTDTSPASSSRSLEAVEREHILAILRTVDFNKSKAAEILGIDRVTLHRKTIKYGIIQAH